MGPEDREPKGRKEAVEEPEDREPKGPRRGRDVSEEGPERRKEAEDDGRGSTRTGEAGAIPDGMRAGVISGRRDNF